MRACVPCEGIFETLTEIGAQCSAVQPGQVVARVERAEVRTLDGRQIVGLLRLGPGVSEGLKDGDVDHRGDGEMCFTISEKARLRRRPTRWGRP
jgi:hypothetical protein